jgi:aspartyl protease
VKFRSVLLCLLAAAGGSPAAAAAEAAIKPRACAERPAALCLPLERGDADAPVIRASLDGQGPFFFVLDTASSGTTIDEAAAVRLGLARDVETEQGQGMGGAVETRLYRVGRLQSGPLSLDNYISPGLPPPAFASHVLTGIAGVDVLGRRLAVWDPGQGRVTLGRSGDRPGNAGWTKIEVRWLKPWKVMIPVDAGGVRGWGLVDTGAQHSVLNPAFAAALGLTEPSGRLRDGGEISGLDGQPMPLRQADLAGVRIGSWRLSGRPVRIGALPVFDRLGGGGQPLMVIGMDWLRDRAFAIDYGAETVWLRSDADAPSPK